MGIIGEIRSRSPENLLVKSSSCTPSTSLSSNGCVGRTLTKDLASRNPVKLYTFDQLSALAATYHFCQPTSLIAEDERLMDGLQKRNLAGKPPQTVRLSQDSPERTRFKA
jgi:hypothetical protein